MQRIFILVIGLLVVPAAASADVQRPVLFRATGDQRTELPLVRGQLQVTVRGPIARIELTQTFANPYPEPIEAVYVFPLPHDGAVGGMTMQIGARTIRAVIKRRDEARQMYEKARAEGKTAALLDTERPNIFTQYVANIVPGAQIDVAVELDVLLAPEEGTWELALPTVVGPRYVPGTPLPGPSTGMGMVPDTTAVPGASRITPPAVPPGEITGNNLAVTIDLETAAPITDVSSPTHAISVAEHGPDRRTVTLTAGDMVRDSDLVIRWRTDVVQPTAAVLAHKDGELGHLAVVVTPPSGGSFTRAAPAGSPSAAAVPAREIVFVVDTSGSMEGEPLGLAKRAMRYALERLGPSDTFRILNFASDVDGLAGGAALPADRDNVRRGLSFVNGLSSGGGTEMRAGIRAALAGDPGPGRIRHVVFMTDGFIGNEHDVLAAIQAGLGDHTRIFSFGVGTSVNRSLLDAMATAGRGSAQYLLLDEDPIPQVARFYRRIDEPALEGLTIDWGGLDVVDVEPKVPGDVFAGQPVVVVARYRGAAGAATVRVRGTAAGRPVTLQVPVALPATGGDGTVIGRLWARRRIAAIELAHPTPDEAVTADITGIALAYALATRFTSFVAVEDRVVVDGGLTRTVQVPVEVPRGVSFESSGARSFDDLSDADEATYAMWYPQGSRVTGEAILGALTRSWWITTGVGAGVGGGGPIGGLSLSIDRRILDRFSIGLDGQLVFGDGLAGSLSLTLASSAILRWIDLRLGIGAAFVPDGPGVAVHGGLAVPWHPYGLGPAAFLRVDGALVPDADDQTRALLGLEWRF